MKKNKPLIIAVLALVIIAVGVFAISQISFWSDNKTANTGEQNVAGEKADTTAGWATYRNTEIGIEFKYPKEWGDIVGYQTDDNSRWTIPAGKEGLKSASLWVGKSDPRYDDIYINDSTYFTAGAGFSARPMGGSDSSPNFIENQSDIDGACSDEVLKQEGVSGCKVYKNENGMTIARVFRSKQWQLEGEYDMRPRIYYYAYIGNRAYPGVSFTLLKTDSVTVEKMDTVIETFKKI
jgi:hypothetical protein